MQNAVMKHAGLLSLDCNVLIKHLDRDGNARPIFQENKLAVALIDAGMLSPLWINTILGRIVSHLRILGFWSTEKDAHNLITTVGNAAVAGLINGVGSVATFASIGQGTSASAAAIGDTTLGTEVTASGSGASGVHVIAAATASLQTTTGTNDTAQFVGSVSETGTIAVTESGVFNATTNGTLLCHQVFTAVNVVSGDSLQFTWKIKVA